MTVTSELLDDLLFDAVTLTPLLQDAGQIGTLGGQAPGGPLQVLTPQAEMQERPQGSLRALTTQEARERLNHLMTRPDLREQLLRELGALVPDNTVVQPLGTLLGATNDEEFTHALMAWTGTAEPEALERHLQSLSDNMQTTLAHLHAGPTEAVNALPTLAVPTAARAPNTLSPLLLGFFSLSLAAQTDGQIDALADGTPPDTATPVPAPPTVTLPKLHLDFSTANLERVLERKFPPDS